MIHERLPVGEATELSFFEAEAALVTYFGFKPVMLELAPTNNPWHRLSDRHAEKEWSNDRL